MESEKVENLLPGAAELGLGAVWLGVHPLSERIDAVKAQFSLPETLRPFAVIAVGCPKAENANQFVDRWNVERVHYEPPLRTENTVFQNIQIRRQEKCRKT